MIETFIALIVVFTVGTIFGFFAANWAGVTADTHPYDKGWRDGLAEGRHQAISEFGIVEPPWHARPHDKPLQLNPKMRG